MSLELMRKASIISWAVEIISADFAQLDPAAETIISREQAASGEPGGRRRWWLIAAAMRADSRREIRLEPAGKLVLAPQKDERERMSARTDVSPPLFLARYFSLSLRQMH
jgi:hypothetical protein